MRDDFPLPDLAWEPTRPFWEGAAAGELRIPRCEACGHLEWYPKPACSACGGEALVWTPMSGRATLFSWVVVAQAFLPQFADKVPYLSALVALEEDPAVRLATQIVDAGAEDLAFDMALEVTFRPLAFAGVAGSVVAPFFRPA